MSSSPQDESDFTLAQQVAITIVPSFTGFLSLLGSGCIIKMLLADRRKLKSVKYRFLFCLCISDVINSLWFLVFSLPIPKGTPGVWGALGNYSSCNAQGFFFQFGIIGSFYNGALSLYFLKALCGGMKDKEIAERYEKWVHLASLIWPLATSIAALQQDLYSYSGLGCWIAPEPLRCHRRDDVDCIRGENAYIFAWVYTGIPLVLLCIYIVYAMYMIYKKVKEVSRKADRWTVNLGASVLPNASSIENLSTLSAGVSGNFSVSQSGQRLGREKRNISKHAKRTRDAAWQALFYVIAYAITHMWAFVVVNIELGGGTAPSYLIILQNFFWPLQGFCNVIVFLRPRIKSVQKYSPKLNYIAATYHAIFHYDEERRRSNRPESSTRSQGAGAGAGAATSSSNIHKYSNGSDMSFHRSTGEESDASCAIVATTTLQLDQQSSHDRVQENIPPVIPEDCSAHVSGDFHIGEASPGKDEAEVPSSSLETPPASRAPPAQPVSDDSARQ